MHSDGICLVKCLERSDCYAVQVVYGQPPGGSSQTLTWCMLLGVGTDGANVTSHSEAGTQTALTQIEQWASSTASHVTELQNMDQYKTSWHTAVIVKGTIYKYM